MFQHVRASHVRPEHIQLLYARTAILADVHAKIGVIMLGLTLEYILHKITTPDLFETLLYTFISRSHTDTGGKLSTESWERVRARFDQIPKSWWGASYEQTKRVMEMFKQDSLMILGGSRVPWREVQDFQDLELRGLCEAIRRRVEGEGDGEGNGFGMDMTP